MKSILHLKFIALYIIFGFLCLFTTATLTTQLVTNRLMEDTSQTLYREATLIASDYLPSYFPKTPPYMRFSHSLPQCGCIWNPLCGS